MAQEISKGKLFLSLFKKKQVRWLLLILTATCWLVLATFSREYPWGLSTAITLAIAVLLLILGYRLAKKLELGKPRMIKYAFLSALAWLICYNLIGEVMQAEFPVRVDDASFWPQFVSMLLALLLGGVSGIFCFWLSQSIKFRDLGFGLVYAGISVLVLTIAWSLLGLTGLPFVYGALDLVQRLIVVALAFFFFGGVLLLRYLGAVFYLLLDEEIRLVISRYKARKKVATEEADNS